MQHCLFTRFFLIPKIAVKIRLFYRFSFLLNVFVAARKPNAKKKQKNFVRTRLSSSKQSHKKIKKSFEFPF